MNHFHFIFYTEKPCIWFLESSEVVILLVVNSTPEKEYYAKKSDIEF